jgi:hypothetical protein
VDAALPLLEAAAQAAPCERDIQEALTLARSGEIIPGGVCANLRETRTWNWSA